MISYNIERMKSYVSVRAFHSTCTAVTIALWLILLTPIYIIFCCLHFWLPGEFTSELMFAVFQCCISVNSA